MIFDPLWGGGETMPLCAAILGWGGCCDAATPAARPS